MVMKILMKINSKLHLFHRQKNFLNPKLYILLCNSYTETHFDYECISWYPLASLVGSPSYRIDHISDV